jgi:hypothetical protein
MEARAKPQAKPAFAIVIAVSVALGACDSRQPTTPTLTGSTSSAPPWTPREIAGIVVDDDDRAVAGAEVRFFGPPQLVTVITDAIGAFKTTVELRQLFSEIRVQKAGYEPSAIDAVADARNLVRLYPVTNIAVGEVRQLSLLDGSFCGGEFEYYCRRVRVRSSAPGLLTVDVFPANYRLVLAGPIQYPDRSTSRLSVTVQAAEEIALDVLIVSNLQGQPTAFTLSSSLAPH